MVVDVVVTIATGKQQTLFANAEQLADVSEAKLGLAHKTLVLTWLLRTQTPRSPRPGLLSGAQGRVAAEVVVVDTVDVVDTDVEVCVGITIAVVAVMGPAEVNVVLVVGATVVDVVVEVLGGSG